jgi:hypothetical protein
MESAMAEAGEEDSEEDEDDDEEELGELDEDEEMRSFHTESEDEGDEDEEDDEDEDEDEDDSEMLEDEPLDNKTRALRAKMQAMMEAAEARAAAMDDRPLPSASASKEKTSKLSKDANGAGIITTSAGAKGGILKAQPQKEIVAAEDEGAWDLTPGIVGKPLSAKVLAAAARAEEERQAKEAVKKEEARRRKREEGERRKKQKVHKKRTEETARAVE